MAVLWKKSWLWDIRYCWYDYPHHAVEGDVWWYYMIELTFYWSLTFSQFYDVKRKGSVDMPIDHFLLKHFFYIVISELSIKFVILFFFQILLRCLFIISPPFYLWDFHGRAT